MANRVVIRPSGHEISVESDESVLDAALRQGYALPYGCRNGTCAACLAETVSGSFTYANGRPPALTEEGEAAGEVILCQAQPQEDAEVEVQEVEEARDIVVRTLPVRLAAIEDLCHDVKLLKLKLPAAERLQFLAGQYIDLLLKDGKRRSFSLANPPHDDEYLQLHVRRVPGGRFSDQLLGDMKPKAVLRFEGPLGSFYLREESDRPAILMAGGTGFAPLKSMVEHAIASRNHRPLHIFWGVRALRDLYMAELAQSWADAHDWVEFTPVLSDPEPADEWTGATGFVHEAVVERYPDLSRHEVYMSGPPAMIESGRNAFRAAGLPRDALFFDSFDYAPDAVQGMAAAGIDPG